VYILDFITQNCNNQVRIIDEIEESKIVNNLIEKYIDMSILEQRILLWNSFKEEYKECKCIISLSQLKEINIPNRNNLYIYLDRNRKLFQGSFEIISGFYEQQEPWEETDITIFDESFKWLIAFTHEDEIVTFNLGNACKSL
jgi:hypothetical protein